MNELTIERNILWDGYFFMTMEHNWCKFVQKCQKYQVYADLIKVPPHELNVIVHFVRL